MLPFRFALIPQDNQAVSQIADNYYIAFLKLVECN